MDLLRIEHEDFTLTVESTQFQRMWNKGERILGRERLKSPYRWSEGVEHVMIVQDDTEREIVNDRFSWKEGKQLLAGFLNYGNEIGRADMPIGYTVDGMQ